MNYPNTVEPTSNCKALTYRVAFTVLALFIFITTQAQVKVGVRQKNLSKDIVWKELPSDVTRFPKDTARLLPKDSMSLAYKNEVLYFFNGYKWLKLEPAKTSAY